MGLITKEVEIGVNGKNVKWFEDKGYIIPKRINNRGELRIKRGTKIKVNIEDVADNSNIFVEVQCDACGTLKTISWLGYKRLVEENGKYYCRLCSINNNQKFISFYDWCYENLSKEEVDKLLSRWDYEKNTKNGKILSPKDISIGSNGFNGKGYWFKCLDNLNHISEQKNIAHFIKGDAIIECKQCSSIATTNPELLKYLVDKNDALKYSKGSSIPIQMICPNCGYIKNKSINSLLKNGFGCLKCSDKFPYSEKFLFNLLEQLKISFITQLNKKQLAWCEKYRYDFYILPLNYIIETNGLQHYEETGGNWKPLNSILQTYLLKKKLAINNGIKKYIIIDCRFSNLDWIKNSIMNSELPTLLNFKEDNIDWLKCHEYACNSLVKEVCDLWNSGISDTLEIADYFKTGRGTIVKYLKQGAKLGWCDYNPKINSRKNIKKKVICLTTNLIFESIREASKYYGFDKNGIIACCRNKQKSAGKHPDTGEPLSWMYYDDYLKLNNK